MIFGWNIGDNCTNHFYQMTSDNVWASFPMQRKLLSVFKKSFEAEYMTVLCEKHIYNKPNILQDDSVTAETLS